MHIFSQSVVLNKYNQSTNVIWKVKSKPVSQAFQVKSNCNTVIMNIIATIKIFIVKQPVNHSSRKSFT